MLKYFTDERIVAQEMATIASECATVLRTLGNSVKNMKKFSSENIMKRAEEAAVALQFKIYLNTNVLLGNSAAEGLPPSSPFANKGQGSGNWTESAYIPEDYFRNGSTEEGKLSREPSQPISIASYDGDQESLEHRDFLSSVGSPAWSPGGSPQGGILRAKSGPVKKLVAPLETLTEGVPSIHVAIPKPSVDQPAQEQGERTTPRAKRTLAWQHTFTHRKSSLGPHWDGTLERISALSLVKFASLLIEVVTKMRYVVDCVDELGDHARFQECES